jgi:hypothetical protein
MPRAPDLKTMVRLRGLANICNLTTKCPSDTCNETVTQVNTTILLALVKGLVDDDTKGEVLSKVEQLDLDETVKFMEARETGQRSLVGLASGNLASQLHSVHRQ